MFPVGFYVLIAIFSACIKTTNAADATSNLVSYLSFSNGDLRPPGDIRPAGFDAHNVQFTGRVSSNDAIYLSPAAFLNLHFANEIESTDGGGDTFSLFIRQDSGAQGAVMWTKDASDHADSNRYQLWMRSNNMLYFDRRAPNDLYTLFNNVGFAPGVWQHLTMVKNGAQWWWYINGESIGHHGVAEDARGRTQSSLSRPRT